MTTYLISRHPGAIEWAGSSGIVPDTTLPHLDPEILVHGDVVIGTLPVNLAAEVCDRGCRYVHLSLHVPAVKRGIELSAEELREYGAHLQEYRIRAVR